MTAGQLCGGSDPTACSQARGQRSFQGRAGGCCPPPQGGACQPSRYALEPGLPAAPTSAPGSCPERNLPRFPRVQHRSLGPPSPPGCRVTSGAAVTGGLTLEQDPKPWGDQAGGQGPGAAEQEGGPHHRTPFPSCPGSRRHPVGGRGAPRPGSAGLVLPQTELAHTARFDPPTGWGCVLSEVVPGAGAWGGLASSWSGHPVCPWQNPRSPSLPF